MTKNVKRGIVAGALVAGALFTTTGCLNKATEPFKDAPTAGHNESPALVIEMPDGFSNLATKCLGDIRYTVAYKADSNRASVTTVVDPQCTGTAP